MINHTIIGSQDDENDSNKNGMDLKTIKLQFVCFILWNFWNLSVDKRRK